MGALDAVRDSAVTIRLTALAKPWRLGQAFPGRSDCLATLDLARGAWRIAA